MDPGTVISIMGVAYSVAKGAVVLATAIHQFKNDVRDFDSKAEDFANEIKALGDGCEMVRSRLELILEEHDNGSANGNPYQITHSGQLWTCLQNQIDACDKTVRGLHKVLRDTIRSEGPSRTWTRVLRQLTLYLKVFDIDAARERIRSHTASLQIVLLSIAIEISYLIPRRIDQRLNQRLEDQLSQLREMKNELSLLRSRRPQDSSVPDRNEDEILKASDQIIRSGNTLYSGSTAGGSSLGGFSLIHRTGTQEWVDGLVSNSSEYDPGSGRLRTEFPPASPSSQSGDSLVGERERPNRPPDEADEDPLSFDEDENDDNDEDSDEEVNVATFGIQRGRKEFERGDYRQAENTLQDAMRVIIKLPMSRQGLCDKDEIRYMLAHSAYYLRGPASAKHLLTDVVRTSAPGANRDILKRTCDASHLLSQACVKLGEFEPARTHCTNAMRGRQRLFGKSHELVYDSNALIGRIHELQGNLMHTEYYRTRIPESYHYLLARYEGLNVESSDAQDTLSSPIRPPSHSSEPSSEHGIEPPNPPADDRSTLSEQVTRSDTSSGTGLASLASGIAGLEVLNTNTVSALRTYTFKNQELQDWADSKGYLELGSLSLPLREQLLKETNLMPASRIEKALAAANDDEALTLSSTRSKHKPILGYFRFSLVSQLRLAVLFGVTSVVKVLLEKGIDLDAADAGGWTMLHYAALSGSISTTQLLIKAGACVSAAERKGNIGPLSLALRHNYLDVCDLLCHHGAQPLREFHWKLGTPLHLACAKDVLPLVRDWSNGHLERVTSVVHSVAPKMLDKRFREMVADFGKTPVPEPRIVKRIAITPIGVAALMGSIEVMKWAISKGIRTFELCRLGDTEDGESLPISALGLAAAAGQTKMVKLLMREHVNVERVPSSPEALKLAVLNKMEDTASWLFDAGVQVDDQTLLWAKRNELKRFSGIYTPDRATRSTATRVYSNISV